MKLNNYKDIIKDKLFISKVGMAYIDWQTRKHENNEYFATYWTYLNIVQGYAHGILKPMPRNLIVIVLMKFPSYFIIYNFSIA